MSIKNGVFIINSRKASTYCGIEVKKDFISCPAIKIIGKKNKHTTNETAASTIAEDADLFILFESLSTNGFKEQAITNDAKNKIAMSLIFVIKTKNNNAIMKNIIFFAVIYFGKIFSNIKIPLNKTILS